jgi:2-dehydropantoate 2-reductase
MAGATCLMRATLGDILATPAADLPGTILDECVEIAKSAGFPPRDAVLARMKGILTQAGSQLTASMLKDIERGARTEVDQILGDLLQRRAAISAPLLQLAYSHVKAYELRQAREKAVNAR